MRLYIAEKPSVARVICKALGVKKSCDGYKETKSGDIVTWCFGHMLELAAPDYYLSDTVSMNKSGTNKVWREEDLPIFPKKWVRIPKVGCKKQLAIIGRLIKKCSTVVNCGDPDREGQLLVDEIIDYFKCSKPVFRYWSSAQDEASVKRALSTLLPNKQFEGMGLAAQGRQRADWLIGMNLTRAYTLAAKRCNQNGLLAIGRVQTPTLNLVAQRDIEIKSFNPVTFYKIESSFTLGTNKFTANLDLSGICEGLDKAGRLVDEGKAKQIAAQISSIEQGTVVDIVKKQTEHEHPKSLSLADIQAIASNRWGFSAQRTLNICQRLYEVHKLTTYPRSDSSYLPEVQFSEAHQVLSSLAKGNSDIANLIAKADTSIKSKTWDDSKVTAHHGIIPTKQIADRSKLSSEEEKIYLIVVRYYLAQFFPKCVTSTTKLIIKLDKYDFIATGNMLIRAGFREVLEQSHLAGDEKKSNKNQVQEQILPQCSKGACVTRDVVSLLKDKTRPPSSFNEGSLVKAMENIASVVEDPNYRKLLKEGDGIGTSATRAGIIEELKNKGYLEAKTKKLRVTELGFKLLKNLPDIVKNPVLTAMFERKLQDIANGKCSIESFEKEYVQRFVCTQVEKARMLKLK